MEADLQSLGVSLVDRWRHDAVTGRPLLTLRRLHALVWCNPGPAVLRTGGSVPWTRTEHLLDELRRTQLLTHGVKNPKPFPGRLDTHKKKSDDIEKRRAVNRERAERRRRELDELEVTDG